MDAQLYVVVDLGRIAPSSDLAQALIDAGAVCVCFAGAAHEANVTLAEILPFTAALQRAGVSVLASDAVDFAGEQRLDGLHLSGNGVVTEAINRGLEAGAHEPGAVIAALRDEFGPNANIGFHAGTSRHAAMAAAEAGADYIAFDHAAELTVAVLDNDASPATTPDAPDAEQDTAPSAENDGEPLVSWWAAVAQLPGVAWDVRDAAEADAASDHGAEFVAVDLAAIPEIGLSSGDRAAPDPAVVKTVLGALVDRVA
ncbi:MAG: thiamine phosphate synthase [Pseudomonadota bacterium]